METNYDNNFQKTQHILNGKSGTTDPLEKSWDSIVADKIKKLVASYKIPAKTNLSTIDISPILEMWHKRITTDYKHDTNFTPHINGFYMIFMVHGTWYKDYLGYVGNEGNNNSNEAGLSKPITGTKNNLGSFDGTKPLSFNNPDSYFGMLATDIDVPDITEEYISVSSRLRNSFVPSRHYFVSDFSISYIENINLDVMRYHEAWHKYMNLIRRGEVEIAAKGSVREKQAACKKANSGYFTELPYANAVWIAIFKPFTTDIQMLIKLMGVMPVTMPLKQVVGNRSASKMTVLNISYKAADLFYKFYNNTAELLNDDGMLAKSFLREVMHPDEPAKNNKN
jgi:hypothetical protein